MSETPAHQQPAACYVCGGEDHGDTFTQTGKGHNYWSNADAKAYFAAEDARMGAPRYSNGTTSPEANYVAEHRPY